MKKSHSHAQPRKLRSIGYKRNQIKMNCPPLKDNENLCKGETIFNIYNNNMNANSDQEIDESTLGDIEFAKTLQLALKDAINQNEKLCEYLSKSIQENKELREEIEEKDNVIYELSQYYQFCQNHHLNNNTDYIDNNNTSVEYTIGSKKKKNTKKEKSKKRKCITKVNNEN